MNGYTDQVSFHINGKKFIVNAGQTENSHVNSLLVDYIRREAALTGTMCREGKFCPPITSFRPTQLSLVGPSRASWCAGPTHAEGLKGYDIWALNVTEVEVNILTGQFKIARVDVIQDAGKSMSPEVDIGQVEGSLIMGIGLYTLEKLQFDDQTGELLTNNTWEYKPPFAKDIPEDMRITLLANAPNPIGVHGSKTTGEPPLCTSVAVVFAIKQAIDSARQDAGNFDHYQLNTPVTPESVVLLSLAEREHLKIQNCDLSQAARQKLQKILH